jgi:hypothetical protein
VRRTSECRLSSDSAHGLKMIRLVREGRRRGAVEHFYALTAAGRRIADDVAAAAAILEGRRNGT